MLLCCALCSCGKSHAPPSYQAAADPDPERAAENQLRQLLVQVNAREMEVAAMSRAAENEVGASSSVAAREERDRFYTDSEYLNSLRAAQSAITNKMTALATERAILANARATNAIAPVETSSTPASRGPADERAEEMKLKERLLELQALNEELLITAPPSSQMDSQTEIKAETAREDIYSPEEYVAAVELDDGAASPEIERTGRRSRGLPGSAEFEPIEPTVWRA